MKIDALIKEYVQFAAIHGDATIGGDFIAANTAYDQIQRILVALVRINAGEALFDLYDHSNEWVQVWAASHSLEIDDQRAIAKLRQLELMGISHVSTTAHWTSKEWLSGGLRFL